MLCLSCKTVSPHGTIYCNGCGRSLGCRSCGSGHVNPMSAKRCGSCGSGDLSEPTRCLALTGLHRVVAWGVTLLVMVWALHHLSRVVGSAWSAVCWGTRSLFGAGDRENARYATAVLTWFLMALLVSLVLPDPAGSSIRRAMLLAARWAVKATVVAVPRVAVALYRLVEGKGQAEKKSKKRS